LIVQYLKSLAVYTREPGSKIVLISCPVNVIATMGRREDGGNGVKGQGGMGNVVGTGCIPQMERRTKGQL